MLVRGGLWVPMLCRGMVLVDTTAEKGFSTGRGNLSDYVQAGEEVLQDGAVNMLPLNHSCSKTATRRLVFRLGIRMQRVSFVQAMCIYRHGPSLTNAELKAG